MLSQNRMPPATTKWQALFGGVSLAQPTPSLPSPQTPPVVQVDIDNGAMIALRIGVTIVGMAVGVAVSYGICCLGMKRCR